MKISKVSVSIITPNLFVASPNPSTELAEEAKEYDRAYGYQLHSSLNLVKDPFLYSNVGLTWWLHLPSPWNVSDVDFVQFP